MPQPIAGLCNGETGNVSMNQRIRRSVVLRKEPVGFDQFGSCYVTIVRFARGIPLFEVDPAYTSQTGSRCWKYQQTQAAVVRLPYLWPKRPSRRKTEEGKIARRGMPIASKWNSKSGLSVSELRTTWWRKETIGAIQCPKIIRLSGLNMGAKNGDRRAKKEVAVDLVGAFVMVGRKKQDGCCLNREKKQDNTYCAAIPRGPVGKNRIVPRQELGVLQ